MAENILIVDDSSSMRQMVKFALMEKDYNIVEANDGKDGIDKLYKMDSCKLIISDIHMPEINGIEFVKLVRGGDKHKFVPIIILTTESEKDMQEAGRRAGASAWIIKPFTPEKLNNVIKKILG